jgi:hypothetical protein
MPRAAWLPAVAAWPCAAAADAPYTLIRKLYGDDFTHALRLEVERAGRVGGVECR